MHPALQQTAHRPWPLPRGPWLGRQSWRDLLFAHWPVPVAAVRPLVPAALEIDTYDGQTYLGIVPFRMAGVMLRGLPDVPGFSAFPELNVRVYVRHNDRPGVWFLSLDATNVLAVIGARLVFHLPYYWAGMSIAYEGETVVYRSERRRNPLPGPLPEGEGVAFVGPLPEGEGVAFVSPLPGDEGASFAAHYRPTSPVYAATPGTLEYWLTERYCLYAQGPGGAILRAHVHHWPWPLQQAAVEIAANTVSAAGGLPVSGPPSHLHFARRLDVIVWPPRRVRLDE